MLLPDSTARSSAVGKLEDLDIERVDPAYRAPSAITRSASSTTKTAQQRRGVGSRRSIHRLARPRARSLDYGVAAFIERDANSILDFVDLSRVGPLALAATPSTSSPS